MMHELLNHKGKISFKYIYIFHSEGINSLSRIKNKIYTQKSVSLMRHQVRLHGAL